MINVRVRQDDRIQFGRLAGKRFILLTRLCAMPLEQPAIEQHAQSPTFNQMLTAGDFARGA